MRSTCRQGAGCCLCHDIGVESAVVLQRLRMQVQFDGSDCGGIPTEIFHLYAPFLGLGGYSVPTAGS